jgi:hypothetical protein
LALIVVGAMAIGYAVHAMKVFLTEPDHFGYLYRHGGHEILRVTSPDKRLDAVVYRLETGALSHDVFYLHIFPGGTKRKNFDAFSASAVLVSDGPLDVHWADPFHLQVDAGAGTLSFFTNLWAPPSDNLPFVEVTLVSNHPVLKPDGNFNY